MRAIGLRAFFKVGNKPEKSSVKLTQPPGALFFGSLRQSFQKIKLAYLSLIFVGLMWVLPFIYYYHAYPRTTFYQEWTAAFLGLCAMPFLVMRRFWVQPTIPRIVMLPVGLILLVVVQFAMDLIVYFDQALLYSLYLLWAALLMMLGYRLREEFGLPLLTTVMAVFLLLGAEINALLGVLQHYRWHTFLDSVVTVKTSAAVYGNIAQPNHFSNYITLGLISLGLLRMRFSLSAWQVLLFALPLLFVLVLSGSRGGGVYLIWIFGLALLWYYRDKSRTVLSAVPATNSVERGAGKSAPSVRQSQRKASRKAEHKSKPESRVINPAFSLLQYSFMLLLGYGLMHLVVQLPGLVGADGMVTTAQRLFGEGVKSGDIRIYLWHEGWLIFTKFPLLGAGFGQYAWQHFLLAEQLRDANIAGLYNNAHNLVIQVAAELGSAGLLIMFGSLALWLYQAVRIGERNVYHWWGYSILAVLGIHSLLEYPLWYAYFLGVAALTLGMLDNTSYRLELRWLGRLSVSIMLMLGLLSLVQMWQGYRKLEALLAMRPASAADNESYNRYMREGMLDMHKWTMMVSVAELYMTNMVEMSTVNLPDKRALNGRVMRYVPISPVVYREALLLALSGKLDEAKLQITRAIWSYPADFVGMRRQLDIMAAKDPAHFAALLEFAVQKYEEWQRHGVPAK